METQSNIQREELIRERKSTAAKRINLELQNEQLKILIEKLHNIALEREDLFSKVQSVSFSKEVDHLYLKKSSITDEIKIAKESCRNLERDISTLRKRLVIIDELLAN